MMKRYFYIAILGLIPWLFNSCMDDDGYSTSDFIIELGNIKGTPGDFVVVTDRGDTLFPSVNHDPAFTITDNKRVWIDYTILGNSTQPGYDYLVMINNLTSMLTKDTVMLSPENVDSIGHDPIIIEDYWIANDYLNMMFSYPGSPYYVHYINLAMDPAQMTLEDGTPIYELRHNKNGDPYDTPPLYGYISIDLRPFKTGESGSYTLRLRAKDYSGAYRFDQNITYTWGQQYLPD